MRIDDTRVSIERPRAVRSVKPKPTVAETTLAAVDFTTDLLTHEFVSKDVALRALERLQRRTEASRATLWIVSGARATCELFVGGAAPEGTPRIVELVDRKGVIERLRRHGALLCRSGEVSGVEELVPDGVRSFVVASGPSPGGMIGVLVIGWDAPEPPCDETALAPLRVAAALLQRALTPLPDQHFSVADAILGSLADRIAVLDREGTIIAVNAAWSEFARRDPTFGEAAGLGVSYVDLWRRAAVSGSAEVRRILAGIQAVARDGSNFFQAAYACQAGGDDKWCVLTATPLPFPSGGAVVAHRDVTAEPEIQLAQRIGEKLFHGLADALPMPVWVLGVDGRVLHGNERWMAIVRTDADRRADPAQWTDAFHADDRASAIAAFTAAVASRASFNLELRLRMVDGTYRWSSCSGAPQVGADGQLQAYVACTCDVSERRHAEWALGDVASKLVAAQEAERSRLGRELHDDLGQQTALLAAKLETLLTAPRLSSARLRAGVEEAQRSLQEIAVAIHSLSHQLHPAKLLLLGLVQTLEALCRDVAKESGLDIKLRTTGIPSDLPQRIALSVWRLAQEALQNAVKHSGAHEVDVYLTSTASQLTLRVSDKGRGFDPLTSEAAGIGLLTMRERVELSGGRLRIDTEPGGGTTIEATLPIRR